MNPAGPRAIIFDFNGVILDDETWHYEALAAVLAEEGMSLSRATYDEDFLGVDDEDCFRRAWTSAGRSEPEPEASEALVARKARRYLEKASGGWRLFPGVIETLKRLASELPLAINSGALKSEILVVLQDFGLEDLFVAVVAGDEHPRSKPHPEGYLMALDALRQATGQDAESLPASACLAIEDAPRGLDAARAAGLRCLGVTSSCDTSMLEGLADAVLPAVDGLSRESLAALLPWP
jgi:beta-phosphoglucomutase